MKGLLVKDFYMTFKYARILLILVFIYGVAGVLSEDMSIFALLPVLLVSMLPNMMYTYDEREKWTVYAQALPVSRKQYVSEKYLFGLIALAVYAVLITLVYVIASPGRLAGMLILLATFGLIAPSLLLPLMFSLGSEKGRIAYYLLVGAMAAGSLMLTGSSRGTEMLSALAFPGWALVLIAAAIYLISWRLSIVLYNRREL